MMGLLVLCLFAAIFNCMSSSTEVCTNTFLPGAKGNQGETGDEGFLGKLGKEGPTGLSGVTGETGQKGEMGHTGKMGPIGVKGDEGDLGLVGPSGFKGRPGSTCDCGRYRKVVGQLDVNIVKLRNAVKFVKNVVLGLKETEDTYYLLVKEVKRFGEASMNCKLRGGTLAMPKIGNTNRLMADYVSQAGLTRVYIGVQARSTDTEGIRAYVYADSSPLQGFAAWSPEEELHSGASTTNSSCVELLSTGAWARVECEASLFFICEFPKTRRGGAAAGTTATASS